MLVNLPEYLGLNDEWLQSLEDYVAEIGQPHIALADVAGCSASTVRAWLARGEEDSKAGRETGYANVLEVVTRGMMRFQAEGLRRIRDLGERKTDWKAEQYLLSVSDPDTFHLPARTRENEPVAESTPEKVLDQIREARRLLYEERMAIEEERLRLQEERRRRVDSE